MLESFSLTNFKSWADTGELRLAPFTGFFGTNSSGKTSLLQLFLMMKQTVESSDRAQVLQLGDEKSLVSLGTYRDILFAHDPANHLKWSIEWKLAQPLAIEDPEPTGKDLFSGDRLRFDCEVRETSTGEPYAHRMRYGFDGHEFEMRYKEGKKPAYSLNVSPDDVFALKRTVGRPWELPAPLKCYGFPDQVKAYHQNAGFLSDFQFEFEKLFGLVYYLGPLREYPRRQYTWAGARPADMGQRGERVVDALLASRERGLKVSRGRGKPMLTVEEYVAYWLRELKLIDSFQVQRLSKDSNLYKVMVCKSETAADVQITDVGFGVSQILPVIAMCYYVPKNSVILLEQPEIHLHPSVQAGLADVFIDAIRNRNIQIIIESHSEHLLRRLARRIAEERFSAAETALFFCDMRNGHSRAKSLDVDLYGNIQNWPKDFFGDEFGEIAATHKAAMNRRRRAAND